MLIRYSQWIAQQEKNEDHFEQLLRLFSYLLMQTGGDVDESLNWMSQLDEQHRILGKMTMQEFIDRLKEQGLIREEEGNNDFDLTARGAQRIRQDALREIFTSLKKTGPGEHNTPHVGSGVEPAGDLRNYLFGDHASQIDPTSTLSNALKRESDLEQFRLEEEIGRAHV